MVDVIEEPETCPSCGQFLPTPPDGKWRFAKSGKAHETLAAAEEAASALNKRSEGFEFRAVTDERGQVRIASRRLS